MGNSPSATWISSAASGDGSRIYALEYGGAMYLSTNFGSTWTAIRSGSAAWEGVATSQDGMRVAAVVQNGPLIVSSDGGSTWRNATLPDGQANHWWRWIASSSDGQVLVAVAHTGDIFRSTNGGTAWQRVTVNVGGAAVTENWYRVKTSSDGQTIAVVANAFGGASGTGIYVSHDGGLSWTRGISLVADYTFLAMSADGRRIAATVSDTGATQGRVLLSLDGGATFSRVTIAGGDTDWRAIAMSSAGDRVAAAAGGFNTGTSGKLYTGR
jgi:photosystem II stability/assembly factor-like uncharacterized protein